LQKRSFRGAVPIYTFGAVWLVYAMLFPLFRMWQLILALVVALVAGVATGLLLAKKSAPAQSAPEKEAQKAPAASGYGPEVDAIIADGKIAMKEMGRLYASIREPSVRGKINELMAVSDKIIRDAITDPSDVPQIRKFLNYYLPTTIKLLNAYDRMSAQGIEGENISGSMSRIEDMLDTAVKAYKKQLDSLFANQALDIETDIEVMNGMLAREGLGGKSYLNMKDFMKKSSQAADEKTAEN
jgi:5-bromo-4-chloroindolyl phosphate hydrolysis protein